MLRGSKNEYWIMQEKVEDWKTENVGFDLSWHLWVMLGQSDTSLCRLLKTYN